MTKRNTNHNWKSLNQRPTEADRKLMAEIEADFGGIITVTETKFGFKVKYNGDPTIDYLKKMLPIWEADPNMPKVNVLTGERVS